MNEIVNKFLQVRDKFLPEMHLKQLVLLTVLAVHLPKTKKEIEKFMQTGNTNFIIKMSLIRLVFSMIWLMTNQKI